jgi:hypothetical protein
LQELLFRVDSADVRIGGKAWEKTFHLLRRDITVS